jgi:hypothetical protein
MIENIQHDYFIWEEKNSTEQKKNYENKIANEDYGFTTETKNDSTPKDWKDITDPKERKKAYRKNWNETNKDYFKKYNRDNKSKIKLHKKAYRELNKEKVSKQIKAYRENNRDKINTINKNWRYNNKEKVNKQIKVYLNNRLKTDLQFKLTHNLRNRLNSAIKGNYKAGSAVKDLGCSVEELKSYIESKFQPGMTWDNWTTDGWHIDHIKPLSSFDLTDRKQLLEACHYTNLQPLWAKDNIIKSDKLV